MKIIVPDYRGASPELIERHREITRRVGEVFAINPQAPELYELRRQAEELEARMIKLSEEAAKEQR